MAGAHSAGIDALRGLAVLLVWIHHVFAYAGLEVPLAGRLGGLLGVQLFFVISGYLIADSARRYPAGVYTVRRLARIYPAYWVVVAIVSLLSDRVHLGSIRDQPLAFTVNALALAHFWPPALQGFDVTTVNWSLAVELAWYALAPMLVALAPRGSGRAWWVGVFAASVAVSTAWVLAGQSGRLDALFAPGIAAAGVAPVNDFMRFAYIVNCAPAHLAFFAAGALLASDPALAARIPAWALAVAVATFVPFADRWNDWLGVHPSFASGIGLAALFVAVALRERPAAGRWLAWLAPLGRISYPVYLVHVPVLLAALALVRERAGLPAPVAVAAAVLGTLAAAAAVHRFVEEPGIALGRKLTRMT